MGSVEQLAAMVGELEVNSSDIGSLDERLKVLLAATTPLLHLLVAGVHHDEAGVHSQLWIDVLQRLLDARVTSVLDQAIAEGLSLTVALERLLAAEVDASTARRLAGRLRFACLPTPATLADFNVDAAAGIDRNLIDELGTCRYLDSATQHFVDRPAGHGQDTLVGRIGKGCSACRVSHLLHHRSRSGRPLPPRCHRGTLGHHDAILRRTDSPGDR
jgi:hypothetical protein